MEKGTNQENETILTLIKKKHFEHLITILSVELRNKASELRKTEKQNCRQSSCVTKVRDDMCRFPLVKRGKEKALLPGIEAVFFNLQRHLSRDRQLESL